MIKVAGQLTIKNITGSRGMFAVGELSTDVGTFKVKDAILDQYEPGRYQGDFLIRRIYPSSYIYGGRAVIEVRAEVDEIIIEDHELRTDTKSAVDPAPLEPDPLDETPIAKYSESVSTVPRVAQQVASTSDPSAPASSAPSCESSILGADLDLLVELGQPVRLDPTVDRQAFRQQRDELKHRGYRFDASSQLWVPGQNGGSHTSV